MHLASTSIPSTPLRGHRKIKQKHRAWVWGGQAGPGGGPGEAMWGLLYRDLRREGGKGGPWAGSPQPPAPTAGPTGRSRTATGASSISALPCAKAAWLKIPSPAGRRVWKGAPNFLPAPSQASLAGGGASGLLPGSGALSSPRGVSLPHPVQGWGGAPWGYGQAAGRDPVRWVSQWPSHSVTGLRG